MIKSVIITATLFITNLILVISENSKRKYKEEQIAKLKKEKLADGIAECDITEEDLEDEIEPRQIHSWIMGIVICLDVWIIGAIVSHWWAERFFIDVHETDSRKALFGDSFGAVNALVSSLAFAGMIVAFILQRYELRLQRKELKDNRTEMTQQTKQFVNENNNLVIQRFENLFYNMLNLQQKIVDGLRYDYYDNEYATVPLEGGGTIQDRKLIKREVVGRDVFRYLFIDVPLQITISSEKCKVYGYQDYLYYKGVNQYDNTLIPSYFDHYFRHLYKIVQFVDSMEVSKALSFEEAYRYISFVRGTLSRYELVWLYYNALHPDFYKFKELIEKYSFLKALRDDLLAISKECASYYMDLGIDEESLNKAGFGYNDFYFYLTESSSDSSKYQISAFWNKKDLLAGVKHLESWRSFVKS